MEVNKFLIGGYFDAGAGQFSPEKAKAAEHFTIDDLLDFSNEDAMVTDGFFDNVAGASTDSSTVTAVDSCNSSVSGGDHHFHGNIGSQSFGESQLSSDLCIDPYDDLAELEWLSNFVEDSFSTEGKDLQALHYLSSSHSISKPQTPETSSSSELPPSVSIPSDTSKNAPRFPAETPLPCKARSKRSRTAPCDWTTRLLHLLSPADPKPPKSSTSKKKEASNSESSGRKCLHCQAEKTPQWRTGPMGPKTLCNACGVRYKSGRLVPEYRPAASPTFISAKHSNSHRKVLELRRQKDLQMAQQQQFISHSSIFGVTNGCDEYLISHHMGPTIRHMI
ncbi:GATA transcription factor 9-like [Momordica charantia]|uniref:GATA transcription factor n=1 Tax=Momordica charantia TaxID=3673 RepID=A0A6J1CUD7_MOMCH|nr:GATA transcription factor 9-like [Momordica charantia]